MNGAESLVRTLVEAGVNVCFANPGTSEMHMVQGIDAVPEMRAVLGLFEGVCTGAADGYGRMTGTPATTLLHLGPGLGNGIANLHNARRAQTPIINLVGDHASYHVKHDAPLTSDLETIARGVSAWVRTCASSQSTALDAADALTASLTSRPGSKGQIATLGVPADASWGPGAGPVAWKGAPSRPRADEAHLAACARKLDASSILYIDGAALAASGAKAAGRIARATGCRVFCTIMASRVENGSGSAKVQRMPYLPEDILEVLSTVSKLVMVGTGVPVSFFAYQKTPSVLLPATCEAVEAATSEYDLVHALECMADAVNAPTAPEMNESGDWSLPTGELNATSTTQTLGALVPDGAIICTDSGPGLGAFGPMATGKPHTWLGITGGAIGQGGPVSVGAAVACPDRPVFALLGDGAAMYTNQCFWTQAREGLNVTTVIYNNSKYGILEFEYHRLGITEVGERAASLFDLGNPEIQWTDLAKSQGVPGARCTTSEEFNDALAVALAEDGPHLIEVMV